MSAIKRAWLYISRQRMRTVTLFLLLFVMLFLSLLGFSFCGGARNLTSAMRSFLQGHVLVQNQGAYVTDEILSSIEDLDEVAGAYPMDGTELSFPELQLIGGINQGEPTDHLVHITGGDASRHPDFASDTFSLWEGEYTSDSAKACVMISRDLALLNGIALGDTITGYYQKDYGVEDMSNPVTLQVVGIFLVQTNDDPNKLPTWEVPQNHLFCDNRTIQSIRRAYGEDAFYADGAVIRAHDAAQLSSIAKRLQNMYPDLQVEVDDRAFQATAVPLSRMEQTVRYLLYLVLGMSMIVLSLVLVLWVRSRDREMGIYLSMGIEKKNIRLQFVLESVWVAAAAFALAYPAAHFASEKITQILQSSVSQLMHFEMPVTFWAFTLCVCIGLLIVVGATLIAAQTALRLRPKEILSTMS